jgi:hypothetical protein
MNGVLQRQQRQQAAGQACRLHFRSSACCHHRRFSAYVQTLDYENKLDFLRSRTEIYR